LLSAAYIIKIQLQHTVVDLVVTVAQVGGRKVEEMVLMAGPIQVVVVVAVAKVAAHIIFIGV
jgi:hypothetical protein